MKAITIRQPWAWLIVNGHKDVENRSWRTNFRGQVLIHAGKQWDNQFTIGRYINTLALANELVLKHGLAFPDEGSKAFRTGGIIGKVTIADCIKDSTSQWAIKGMWHWVLVNPQPLPFMACKGKQGFFEFKNLT